MAGLEQRPEREPKKSSRLQRILVRVREIFVPEPPTIARAIVEDRFSKLPKQGDSCTRYQIDELLRSTVGLIRDTVYDFFEKYVKKTETTFTFEAKHKLEEELAELIFPELYRRLFSEYPGPTLELLVVLGRWQWLEVMTLRSLNAHSFPLPGPKFVPKVAEILMNNKLRRATRQRAALVLLRQCEPKDTFEYLDDIYQFYLNDSQDLSTEDIALDWNTVASRFNTPKDMFNDLFGKRDQLKAKSSEPQQKSIKDRDNE